MPSSPSRLRVKREDDVIQVEFVDRNILDEANIQQIGDEITEIIETPTNGPHPKLLISFSNVDHLSSAALGMLLTVNNKVKGASGKLRLANIDPQIFEVFKITKLDRIFQIHESTEKAVASLK